MPEKELKITSVTYEESTEEYFKHPSRYFIVDCMGNLIYIHTRDLQVAKDWVTENYGSGKYSVRCSSQGKSSGKDYSATGSNTRKCFSPRLKNLK